VGFILGDVNWIGGINYYHSLLAAIQILPDSKIHPVVFVGFKTDVSQFQGYAEIIRTKTLDRYSLPWWIGRLIKRSKIGRNYIIYLLLRKHNIHLLSHYDGLWKGCKIPSLGWIPDFQHIHLPQFFSNKELVRRDSNFLRQIQHCNALLLSSQDALKDLRMFCPDILIPTYVLNFTPNPLIPKEILAYSTISERYGLDRPWFHLPNQFWVHKNHGVVIEALHILKQKGEEVLVVCTGSTDEYRNPQYFPSLMKRVREYGLEKNIIILGVLPYQDMMSILHHSVATINPSLFEGWSTTVEESKAMGKKIILSNIAVHREQNPQRGLFFNPNSPEDLASIMTSVNYEHNLEVEDKFRFEALEVKKKNITNFAHNYQSIVIQTAIQN
jgi:glycosyltransferase involved in cell wall biosynthesis